MTSHDIEIQLQELADRTAVLDLVIAYATVLDTRNWAALPELFADDAACEYGGSVGDVRGPEAIAALLRATLEPLDATQHLLGNHVVRLTGGGDGGAGRTAEHVGYVQGQHVRRGLPDGELYVVAGRYDDRLRWTPDGWRFTYRRLTRMWSDGNRSVLHV